MRKTLAILLLVFFLLSSVLSAAYISSQADHECSGELCETCLNISHMRNTLEQTVIFAAVAIICVVFAVFPVVEHRTAICGGTPVLLKVRLNH